MPGAHYPLRKKVATVLAAEMSTTMAAAASSGISRQTITEWRKDPKMMALVASAKAELAEDFTLIVRLSVAQIITRIPTMDNRDLIVLSGIAADKSQLLSGKPTERIESVTAGFDDHEKEQLAAVLKMAIAERTAIELPE